MNTPPKKVPAKWIRNKADELAIAQGMRFDAERGQFVCDWIEANCWLFEGKEEPVKLLTWHRDLLMRVFSWVRWSDFEKRWIRRFRTVTVFAAKKNAKALTLDTPIPTPQGWTTIGQLREGDSIFSEDGSITRVIATHPVIEDNAYKFTFSNGEQIECNAEHLWKTSCLAQKYRVDVRSAAEIASAVICRADKARNHTLALQSPLQTEEAALPIHPYVLGYWLGNGSKDCGEITMHEDDADAILALHTAFGYSSNEQNRKRKSKALQRHLLGFKVRLAAANLLHNKHIPAAYLRGSIEQRLWLLRGLMDSDGTIGKRGLECTFTNISKTIVDGMCELLSSLGFKYSARQKVGRIKSIGFEGLYWHVQFGAHSDGLVPFALPRKAARLKPQFKQIRARSRTVQITNAEIGPPKLMRCITVDHPSGMFLCGRTMIPTHNSPLIAFIGLYMLYGDSERGPKICIAATKIEQAALSQKHAIKTVEKSPALAAVCTINKTNKAIICEARDGIMLPISNDKEGSHGINANCLCIDELHVIDSDYAEILDGMTGYRAEPLIFRISTAGNDADSYGYQEYCQGKADEVSPNPPLNKLFVDYSAPQDLKNEDLEKDFVKYARMANPGYGENVNPEVLRQRYDESKNVPSKLAWFRQLYLNIWQLQAGTPLINPSDWSACTWKGTPREFYRKYKHAHCFLGLDFSTVNDFTAACFIFPNDDGTCGVFFQLWLPEKTIARHTERKREYKEWFDAGYIMKGGIDEIEQGFIQREIVKISKKCVIRETCFDPAFAPQNIQELRRGIAHKGETIVEGIGGKFWEIRQTEANLTRPINDLEAKCISHKFEILHNPCADWQMGNLQVKDGAFEGKRVEKTDGWKKIDAGLAMIFALSRALRPIAIPSVSAI